jgi:hypothetical protein
LLFHRARHANNTNCSDVSRAQGPIQEFVQRIDDGTRIVAAVFPQEPLAHQRVDLGYAQLDHQASEPIAVALPVATHALGGWGNRR